MAAVYTAAVAPTRPLAVARPLSRRWIRPTGNCRPARAEREMGFFLSPPAPLMPMVPLAPCRRQRGHGGLRKAGGAAGQRGCPSPSSRQPSWLAVARSTAVQAPPSCRGCRSHCHPLPRPLSAPPGPQPPPSRSQLLCQRASSAAEFERATEVRCYQPPLASSHLAGQALCTCRHAGGSRGQPLGSRQALGWAGHQAKRRSVPAPSDRGARSPLPDIVACVACLQEGQGRGGEQEGGRRGEVLKGGRPGGWRASTAPRPPKPTPDNTPGAGQRSGRGGKQQSWGTPVVNS